ncbi:MAG TPA: hypothetical protein GX012_02535, partial [Acholeplasma sp.]|nr:hypothetical protein [Acholeplasma sp.]
MENISMYVINIQWGIFFGFILINMLIGFKRGFKKTSYYTIVSIGLTLLLMFGISFITINWFFKNPETLVEYVERFVDIPEDVRGIVINESVSPLLYVIIDIVLKIAVFVILYPIIKFILTITIFKPIYKRTIGKNDKIKRPNLGSRLGGSLVGSVKGVFLTVMILLPIIVIAGAFNQYNPTEGNISDTSNNNYVLLEDGTSNEGDLEEIEEIMEIIKLFHENGLGNALSKFKLRGKSIDRQIFDLMFTSRVEDNQGNKVSVKLSEELDSIGLIVQILVEKGYLEDDFDFNEINYDDHFKDLETMIQALGDSKMLNLAVPIAISVLYDEGYITDELGFDVLEKEHTRKAFEALKNFSFKDELNTISNTLKEVLLVGSVEELIELSKNPELIDELSSEQKTSVANILKELRHLQVLKGANIAIEYLLNDEGVLEEITWTNEPYEYLVNQLDFILNNEDFLKEELLSISTLVDNLLQLDFKYSNLLDEEGKFDPQTLLLPNAEALVTTALDGISGLQLVVNGIPLGVDYFLYTSSNTNIQELADQLSEIAQNQDYESEIDNINEIYSIAIALGVSQYFNKEDALVVTDRILSSDDGFANIKTIINNIFVGSNAVNEVLNVAGESILEMIIKDQELLDLALLVVSNEDFSYGAEIVNLINVFESVYDEEDLKLTTIRQIARAKDYAEFANIFGSMEEEKFDSFKESIFNLQTIKFASKELAEFGASKLNNSFLVIPDNANYESIKYDFNKLFDIVYEAAKVIKSENLTTADLTNVNIARVIDLEKFTELLSFDYDEDKAVLENSILLNSLIDNIVRRNDTSLGSFGTIKLPEGLNTRAVTKDWVDEINLIISGVFNVVDAFSDEDEEFILSVNNLKTIKGLKDIPAEVGTRFSNEALAEDTFTNLLTSKILTHNLYNLGLEQLNKFKIPNDIMTTEFEDALKDGNNYVELISIFAAVIDQAITEKGTNKDDESLDSAVRAINLYNTFDIFNNINEDIVRKLANNQIVNNAFREAAVHEYIQNQAYKFINGAKIPAPLNTINSGIFDYKSALDEDGRLKEETLEDLFLLTRDLKLPGNMLKLPGSAVVSTLTTAFNDNNIDGLIEIDFMHDITSNIFLLDQMKEFIGNSAGFNPNDLTLNYTEKDSNDNIDKLEVTNLLLAIKSIGLGGFSNISITTIKDADMDVLLASNYLYEVLDLTVKAQIDDIPVAALEPEDSDYNGLLRKEEFEGMIETLNILELENPNDLDAESITIDKLEEVIKVDSLVIKKLISDQIENFVDVPESSITNGIINDLELQNIVDSLLIINDDDREAKLSSMDSENISLTTTKFGEMLALNSNIVDRLISTEVIKT